uniref:BEN domain-containing protein n=1 Tax=Amphimedon queenslandica TaxID=400682 RepID=A0A1X7SGV2_AMPQE
MEINLDDLQTRLTKTENSLKKALVRIAKLEETVSKEQHFSANDDQWNESQMDQQFDVTQDSHLSASYNYSTGNTFSDSLTDDDYPPPLPPPIAQPHINHSTPDSYRYKHYTSFYPPPQLHSYSQPHPHKHLQTGPALPPVKLSKYYHSQPVHSPTPLQQSTCNPSPSPIPSPTSVPTCLPIMGRKKGGNLSSTGINKESLISPDMVVKKYEHLCKENGVGTLAVKLANESFFGADILKQCTVMGCRDIPALPLNELNELKQTIFSLFPKYWYNQAEFEAKVWNSCTNAIGQLCKRVRQQ